MLQLMPNPDNVPGAVTTGYQRQNTNMFAIQAGLDTTAPFDDGTGVTIPLGGVVETNGAMYRIVNEITLTKPNASVAYWVAVVPGEDGSTATFELRARPGAWDSARNGCYLPDGRRTLDWVSLGEVSSLGAGNDAVVFEQNIKGKWTANLKKGWYGARLASGLGGGNGGNGADGVAGNIASPGGGGGVPQIATVLSKAFFHDGKEIVNIKIGGNGFPGGSGGLGGAAPGSNTGAGGGGGGSGAGEETSVNDITTGRQRGGNGGNGGDGGSWGGGGGGGINGDGDDATSGPLASGNGGTSVGNQIGNGGNGVVNSGGGGSSNNFRATGGSGGTNASAIAGNGGNAGADGGDGITSAAAGGGGGMGFDGDSRADGSTAAGFCVIFQLSS